MACQLSLTKRLGAAIIASVVLSGAADAECTRCRFIPGDEGWPQPDQWSKLNDTVGGRLIATVPQASVCHADPYSNLNDTACAALSEELDFGDVTPYFMQRLNLTVTEWDMAATFILKAGEIANPYWQNQTCDPFTPESKPCELGNMASYSINVTSAEDVIAGIEFARENNIRLTIKNTGHDYMGKSSGQGALALWMFNLKMADIIPEYKGPTYSGPALKMGAGIVVGEAMQAAGPAGYRVVGGECGTVGMTGGYTQGGGHSILNSAYGMAADNVLEWELVTGEGEHVIATPEQNSELYWAMSGGGPGTYGVALSLTAKLHPEGPVAGASLSFDNTEVGNETYWKAVEEWFKFLPSIIKGTRNAIQYVVWDDKFNAQSMNFLDQHSSDVERLMAPLLSTFDNLGLKHKLTVRDSESYFDHFSQYYGPLPYGSQPVSTILNSRLVPEHVMIEPEANSKWVDAIRTLVATGELLMGCTALDANNTEHPDNAVLPAWRHSVGLCIMNSFWHWRAPIEENLAAKHRMAEEYAPTVEAATPDSGVYLNEMDPLYQGDWKQSMYGDNYPRLLEIKKKHDPDNLFYGHFAVGGDEFSIDEAGRLCPPVES